MRITKLKLKNFGKHSSLEKEIKGNVVGILGANGSGKSTIVKALQFAFGCQLDDQMGSYIKSGEKSALIEVEFIKNGKKGVLIRKLNKTSSSISLMYDGSEYKKKAEVDFQLESILGIDAQSMVNTIFVSQGEISSILDVSSSKRVDLFTKILNLNYINSRSKVIERVSDRVKGSLVDVKLLKDQVNSQLLDVEQNIKTLNSEKEALNVDKLVNQEWLGALNDFQFKTSRINDALQSVLTCKRSLSSLESERDKFIEANEDIFSSNVSYEDSAEKLLKSKEEALDKLRDKRVKMSSLMNLKLRFMEILESAEMFKKLSKKFLNKYAQTPEEVFKLIETLSEHSENKKKHSELKKKFEDDSEQTRKLLEAFNELDFENNEKLIDAEILKVEDDLKSSRVTKENLSAMKELKIKLKSKIDKGTATCPSCGLKLMLGQSISENDIGDLESIISSLSAEISDNNKKLFELKLKRSSLERDARKLEADINSKKSNLSAIEEEIKRFETEKGALTSITSSDESDNFLLNLYRSNSEELHQFISLSSSFDVDSEKNLESEELNKIRSEFKQANVNTDEEIKNFEFSKDEFDKNIFNPAVSEKDAANSILMKLREFSQNIKLGEEQYKSAVETNEKLKADLSTHRFRSFVLRASESGNKNNLHLSNLEMLKKDLELELEKLSDVESRIAVYVSQKNKYISQLNELEATENKNKKRYEIMAELSVIQDVLDTKPGGLTRSYLSYLFSHIIRFVSEYLVMLDSNFTVKYDSEHSDLSFLFKRTDIAASEETEGVVQQWLPMTKLSGGQKIKLSIAFLLAVQKIICPDLGFIILDEPSTHLDSSSVESLNDFISKINKGTSLNIFGGNSSENQIWIIDHNEILEQSIDDKIILKG